MKKLNFFYIIIFIFLNFLFTNFSFASSTNNGIDINLNVNNCNNNGICEVGIEDFLTCPNDCAQEESASGGSYGFIIQDFFRNLTVEPNYTSATIKWNSSVPTIYVLKWGTTGDYKNGILKNVHFVSDHSVEITNLESNTIYYFTIESQSYLGKTSATGNLTFGTLVPQDKIAPGNVTEVKISTTTSGVVISWINPPDKDFDYVRIIRNTDRYHTDTSAGRLVYEGGGQYFRDTDVKIGQKYFYTIFARDKNGNYSSGYLINIIHHPREDNIPKTNVDKDDTATFRVTPTQSISYFITQGEVKKDLGLGGVVDINGGEFFAVVAEFEKINHDEMWIQISDAEGKVVGRYSFKDKEDNPLNEEVIVPPIVWDGHYSLSIFKYLKDEQQLIHQASLNVKRAEGVRGERETPWFFIITTTIIIAIISVIIYLFIKKTHEQATNKTR